MIIIFKKKNLYFIFFYFHLIKNICKNTQVRHYVGKPVLQVKQGLVH